MANIIIPKVSFGGGIFSPSLRSRIDLQMYSSGASDLRNFFVHYTGGISNRAGFHYIATGKTSGKKIRLVGFEFSTLQAYIIEFGHLYCRFYTNGGQIQSGASAYEIDTPYDEDDLNDLNFTQSADVLYIAHPDYAPRELSRTSDTSWSLDPYDYTGGPFQGINTDESKLVKISAVTGDDKTLTATGFTFDADHVGALWKLRHYVEGQAVTKALDEVEASTPILCNGNWRLITHGTWTGTIRIEKSTTGAFAGEETMLRQFSSADDFNPETYGTEELEYNEDPFYIRINMTVHSSGTCNADLTSDPWYQEGIVKITAVAVGGATATADVVKTCAATTDTIDWSEGSWSPYAGWPTVVEFHPEDRLVWGNTYTEPQTYWMTRTGNYIDFSRSDPLVDADGISSPLPSRKVNGINGFIPLSELVVLTLSNEASVRSSSGPLSPTSVYNRIYGYEGSYGVRPVLIGNQAIYVQSTGSIIRNLGFDLASDSFKGDDLSVRASQLFQGYTIIDMAYQQNPDRLIWCIRSDGKMIVMTYLREQEVYAWTWFDTGENGLGADSFESVATIRGDGYDEVWVSVERGDDRFIERLNNRMSSTSPEDQFFVDCGITYYEGGTKASIITELDHLEGKDVIALADGNVITGKTVAGGKITLDEEYERVHVGLQYFSDLETLDVDVNLKDGTSKGRKIKISQLVMELLNSRGGHIGPEAPEDDETDPTEGLYAISNAGRATWDDPLALFSGPQKETLSGGYSDGGRIFLRQIYPLPFTLLSIIPDVSVGGMTQS